MPTTGQMTENLNINETARAWAEIVLERWEQKIETLRIGYSLQLEDSFLLDLMSSGPHVSQIAFSFKYYGKFVDMGVGKGVSLGEVKGNITERRLVGRETGNRRRAKKWYSPVFYTEVAKLKHILAEKYARSGVLAIVENIDDNALKWDKEMI